MIATYLEALDGVPSFGSDIRRLPIAMPQLNGNAMLEAINQAILKEIQDSSSSCSLAPLPIIEPDEFQRLSAIEQRYWTTYYFRLASSLTSDMRQVHSFCENPSTFVDENESHALTKLATTSKSARDAQKMLPPSLLETAEGITQLRRTSNQLQQNAGTPLEIELLLEAIQWPPEGKPLSEKRKLVVSRALNTLQLRACSLAVPLNNLQGQLNDSNIALSNSLAALHLLTLPDTDAEVLELSNAVVVDQPWIREGNRLSVPFSCLVAVEMPEAPDIKEAKLRVKNKLSKESNLYKQLEAAGTSDVARVFAVGQQRVRRLLAQKTSLQTSLDVLSGAVLEELYTFSLSVMGAAAVEKRPLQFADGVSYENVRFTNVEGGRLFSSNQPSGIDASLLASIKEGTFYFAVEPGRQDPSQKSITGQNQAHPICDMFFLSGDTLVMIDVAGGGAGSVLPKTGSRRLVPQPDGSNQEEDSKKERDLKAMLRDMNTKPKKSRRFCWSLSFGSVFDSFFSFFSKTKIKKIDVIVLAPQVDEDTLKQDPLRLWKYKRSHRVELVGNKYETTIHTVTGKDARKLLGGLVQVLNWAPHS